MDGMSWPEWPSTANNAAAKTHGVRRVDAASKATLGGSGKVHKAGSRLKHTDVNGRSDTDLVVDTKAHHLSRQDHAALGVELERQFPPGIFYTDQLPRCQIIGAQAASRRASTRTESEAHIDVVSRNAQGQQRRMPTGPLARLPACPLAHLPTCPLAHLPACALARLPACPKFTTAATVLTLLSPHQLIPVG
jgi:hypothetical protein